MRRILAFVLAVALTWGCGFVRSPKGEDTSGNALGALSGSLLDKGNPREQDYSPSPETLLKYEIPYLYDDSNSTLIEHMGYTLSYNSKLRIPNWVAYELLDSELYGDLERNEKFTADPAIRGRQAYDEDYRGSGWDRGHMAPSGDMKWSSQAMDECFYLSNVCPQNHNLNAGSWNDLEKQVRYEARYYGRVWVVCGPVVGRGRYGTVGENKVQVPDGFFKALLAKRKKGSGYAAIGFYFPNASGRKSLSSYAMTVEELEKIAGMAFFVNLPEKYRNDAVGKIDPYGDWRIR